MDTDDGTGHLFQVKGNIQNGMIYESRDEYDPETSPPYLDRTLIGQVDESGKSRMDGILESIPLPKKAVRWCEVVSKRATQEMPGVDTRGDSGLA